MQPLRVVKPGERPRLTLDELLGALHQDRFDEVEASVRQMRESFTCPATVPDYQAFKRLLLKFYLHYFLWFFGVPFQRADGNKDLEISEAVDFAESNLKNYPGDLAVAERNAIAGRDAGMVGVIDAITEGILKLRVDAYINAVFRKLFAPSDFDTRCSIVEELMRRVGPLLFPQDELKHPMYWAGQMEEFVKAYVMHVHALQRQWRV